MANSNGWGDGAANNAIGWGQGANNNIGWGDSHAKSYAGLTDIVGLTTDTDAQAFITAAAITDATQKSAIDTLVKGMKADGIWTKMKAIYPFVGGTATTHKYNLKDPRDLDAAFRLVFNGGWTHSSTGATPNGTNGYADTKLNVSSTLTLASSHLSFYSRTSSEAGFKTDIGATATNHFRLRLLENVNTAWALITTVPTWAISTSVTNSSGFYLGSRTSNTKLIFQKNSSILSTSTVNETSNLPNAVCYLGALNNSGVVAEYSDRQVAFSTIGDGLTDTEAANLYTRVQAFQTSLNRNI